MSLGDRLGMCGLILALIALAVTYLWPDKKWIGWLSLICAVTLLCGWGWLEFGNQIPHMRLHHPILSQLVIFTVGGYIAAVLWRLAVPLVIPNQANEQPACYIFPFGQVVNGELVLMIANQTRVPVDDVDLDILIGYSKHSDQQPQGASFHKQIKWGTCKAMLTTALERFHIGNNPRASIAISGTTRAEGVFAESIELWRDGEHYRGKAIFYKPLGTVRFSEDSFLLPIVKQHPK